MAWDLNTQSLLSVLEIGRQEKLHKIFWPQQHRCIWSVVSENKLPAGHRYPARNRLWISKYAGENWCAYYHAKMQGSGCAQPCAIPV